MKTRRNMVKRWIAGVLAVTMLSSTMSTAAFAAPESTDAPETAETIQVTAWSWTDGSALTWQEDTSAWTLALSETQTISEAADLLALLPVSVEATLAQPETEATPAPESTADTDAAEVTPTPEAEVDPAVEEGATAAAAPAAETADVPEEDTTGVAALSVESEDNEETTPAPETATPASDASTQPAESTQPVESTQPAADAEPTEEPAAEADTETLTLAWDTEALTYPLAGGDYTVKATLPEGYALAEGAPALTVTVQVPGAEDEDVPAADNSLSGSTGAYAPSMLAEGNGYVSGNPVQTVSPVGTTINLFDYWIDKTKEDQYFENPSSDWDWSIMGFRRSDGDLNEGINYNHLLKFSKGGVKTGSGITKTWYTIEGNRAVGTNQEEDGVRQENIKNANVYQGIVANTLAEDGFPYLNNGKVEGKWIQNTVQYEEGSFNTSESLKYLFSPSDDDSTPNSRAIYTNVKGLLKMEDGYYTFDSGKEYAHYNADDNSFEVNSEPWLGFFPFNEASEVHREDPQDSTSDIIGNHYFGMTMTTRFVQQNGGRTTDGNNTPITYEFAGDDDVWVFIDGVLVGDLGGIHSKATLKIDFSTGDVLINNGNLDSNQDDLNTTIRKAFIDAGKETGTTWSDNGNGKTFADNTYHTLSFFYLERGNNESNLMLKFNMESTSESSIYNVDQNGDGIGGSQFKLLPAWYDTTSDKHEYEVVENPSGDYFPITGTTDALGYMTLNDKSGNTLLLNTLKTNLQAITVNGHQCNAVVLREISVPSGYRSHEDSVLYFPDELANEDILLSSDPWSQGTYASPMVTTTLSSTNTIGIEENTQAPNVQPSLTDGIFFAVVMKKDGSEWLPVSGDPINGWHVKDGSGWDKVLEAARESKYIFAADKNGPQVTIDNLPGDISKYYYVMHKNGDPLAADNAEYTVAYYYTTERTLDTANANNTVRLNTDAASDKDITRVFSVKVYVSNPKNYLVVQKVTDDETPQTGATFALYQSTQVTDDGNGNVTVNDGEKPYDTVTTANLKQKEDMTSEDNGSYQSSVITLNGAGVFPNQQSTLPNGIYYLKETATPTGYETNEHFVKIFIDDTGVYADAGAADDDDGVTVLRGAGKIVRSMLQFAVPDDINTTLQNITATLHPAIGVPDEVGDDWTWGEGTEERMLTYTASNVPLEYGPADGNDTSYFTVTSGWSRVTITPTPSTTGGSDTTSPVEQAPGADADLTNLFSRSTVVRVASKPQTFGLTITETVNYPVGIDADKEFEVTVELTNQNGTPVEGELDYTKAVQPDVQDAAKVEDTEATGTWSTDNNTLTLKHGQYITIQVPYDTKYTVTPTVETNYTTEIAEAAPLADGDPTRTETTGTLTANVTIGITNTRKAGSVAVSNTVEGAMGSYSDTFSYTLNLYDVTGTEDQPGKANISGTYTATITKAGNQSSTETVTITFDEKGQATQMMLAGESTAKAITLAHGDTLTIAGLPAGATVEATENEANQNGYTTTVAVSNQAGNSATVPNNDTDKPTITFTNSREAIIPTGLREENHPYIVMIGLAGMAALVGAAGWVEMRRRKRREEE